jgi:prolyl 4-hydroxylase
MPEFEWITDQIFAIRDFFSPEDCQAHVAKAEASGFDAAPINGAFGPELRPEVRNNSRVIIDDAELAATLWERVQVYVPLRLGRWEAVGVNERFRYYRYDLGQQFNWHYDGAFERENGERSQLTFMVYLNDGFEGGETSFESVQVTPCQGMALLFVHQIRHKGEPVILGRKYALRTDVMYRLALP